jgi:hypothetical protein
MEFYKESYDHQQWASRPLLIPCTVALLAAMPPAAPCAADGFFWHERLGHPSAAAMQKLEARGLIPRTTEGPTTISQCLGCAKGKSRSVPHHPPTSLRHIQPGERLHFDITFPSTHGVTGHRFVCTAVDECSRFGFSFPLKHKSDAAIFLKHLILHTAKVHRVLALHCDNDTVFTSQDFQLFPSGSRHLARVITSRDTQKQWTHRAFPSNALLENRSSSREV